MRKSDCHKVTVLRSPDASLYLQKDDGPTFILPHIPPLCYRCPDAYNPPFPLFPTLPTTHPLLAGQLSLAHFDFPLLQTWYNILSSFLPHSPIPGRARRELRQWMPLHRWTWRSFSLPQPRYLCRMDAWIRFSASSLQRRLAKRQGSPVTDGEECRHGSYRSAGGSGEIWHER
jgi:hypothetical protein